MRISNRFAVGAAARSTCISTMRAVARAVVHDVALTAACGSILVGLLILAPRVSAQTTAAPTSHLTWTESAPDAATAQSYAYKYYPDAASGGLALAGVTCTGAASPFTCTAPFPAFTPGAHALTITATNAAGESGKSASIPFSFVVVPAVPMSLQIQ